MLNISQIHIDDFNERLRYQKLVYLLQASGVPIGYRFNWYIRGPYSPGLANSLYNISTNQSVFEETSKIKFKNQDEIDKKISKLVDTLGDNINNPDYLEIIGSLSYIKKNDPLLKKNRESIIKRLIELKPFIKEIPNYEVMMADACQKIEEL